MTTPASAAKRVDQVRRFNRLYTRRIGVLQDGYLRSPFSLAEVRVLYELAHRAPLTASALARDLELDPGYLSRILRNFVTRGLLDRTRSERDGRETYLSLSDLGRATFDPLEASARQQIASLLAELPEPHQVRLLAAMAQIERLLDDEPERVPSFTLRHQAQPGDFGWVVERHATIYHAEYDWDLTFESLVASIVARFVDRFDGDRERVWIAQRAGERVGCVFLVKASKRVAKLRLFLVEPEARGLGIGRQMVQELLAFARSAGYHTVRLWTQSNLLAARHLYAQAGFALISSEPNHAFGHDLVSETWELHL
ncbi:MAG: bifunctional helix-turn-helix transcriptional regulator/GNAT family N-acetyltransferase [Chloroflexi bacterium]|nr:bifunctional helix-turn-helix transcriptional regulator/GNAT family N-acetyltransferase [Chloroflexota bacterium]